MGKFYPYPLLSFFAKIKFMTSSYSTSIPLKEKRGDFDLLDKAIILLGSLLILLGGYSLVYNDQFIPTTRNLDPIAHILHATDGVNRKTFGQFSWTKVVPNTSLYEQDLIFTGSSESTTINFINGEQIELLPNSLIKITLADNLIELELYRGIIEATVPSQSETGIKVFNREHTHIIRPSAATQDRESPAASPTQEAERQFHVQQIGSISNRLVSSEKLVVNESQLQRSVSQGMASATTETEQTVSGEERRQRIASAHTILEFSSPIDLTDLNANALQVRENYRGTKLAAFSDLDSEPILEIDTDNIEASFRKFRPGSYIIAPVTEEGTAGLPIQRIDIPGYTPPSLVMEQNIQTRYRSAVPITLQGREDLTYEVEYQTPSGEIKSMVVKGNQLQIPTSAPGNYSMRARVQDPHSEWSEWTSSRIDYSFDFDIQGHSQNITVEAASDPKRRTRTQRPSLSLPPLATDHTSAGTSDLNVKGYRVEVFKADLQAKESGETETPVLVKRVTNPQQALELDNIEAGIYEYQIVKETDERDFFSNRAPLSIKETTAKFKAPQRSRVTVPPEQARSISHRFEWESSAVLRAKGEDESAMKLEISRDPNFENIFDEIEVTKGQQSVDVQLPETGQYFYRMRPLKEDLPLVETEVHELRVELPQLARPSAPPRQIIPFRATARGAGHLIEVPQHRHGVTYQIQISETEDFSRIVYSKETSETTTLWHTRRSGRYYYRYRYTDAAGRRSPFSNTGSLVFPISPLLEE